MNQSIKFFSLIFVFVIIFNINANSLFLSNKEITMYGFWGQNIGMNNTINNYGGMAVQYNTLLGFLSFDLNQSIGDKYFSTAVFTQIQPLTVLSLFSLLALGGNKDAMAFTPILFINLFLELKCGIGLVYLNKVNSIDVVFPFSANAVIPLGIINSNLNHFFIKPGVEYYFNQNTSFFDIRIGVTYNFDNAFN